MQLAQPSVNWFQLSETARELAIEVRVEDANLGNAIHRQVVRFSGAANRFRRGCIVSTKSLGAVFAHIRVKPRYTVFIVNQGSLPAKLCTFFINGNLETFRKASFNYVARHVNSSSSFCELSTRRGIYRGGLCLKSEVIPILERRVTYFGKGHTWVMVIHCPVNGRNISCRPLPLGEGWVRAWVAQVKLICSFCERRVRAIERTRLSQAKNFIAILSPHPRPFSQ